MAASSARGVMGDAADFRTIAMMSVQDHRAVAEANALVATSMTSLQEHGAVAGANALVETSMMSVQEHGAAVGANALVETSMMNGRDDGGQILSNRRPRAHLDSREGASESKCRRAGVLSGR